MDRNMKTDIVPWKNPAEFIKVYEYAYSDDLKKNRWAVEQMTVWETRCWPSLPTAVEATLFFVRSKIQDQLYEASKSFCNAQEVEMMYSNAVVRFVNLLIEKDQNSKSKKSMAYLAAERNIPLWIVDIRHSSTHGFHPTLPVLRMAHETIMAYLEEIFWLPEKSRVCAIKRTVDETPMKELIQEYRERQYQVVTEMKNLRTSARDRILDKMNNLLSKPDSRRKFLNVLVRDFVTEDDVKSMISDDEVFMDGKMSTSSITLPLPLQEFYYPLIILLHKHNLISTFLELLLLTQEKRELVIFQKIVDYTVIHVLNLVSASNDVPTKLAIPFICKGTNINMYRLLYSCVQGCSTTVRVVFERLVHDLKLQNWVQELIEIMNIKQGTSLYHEHNAMSELINPKYEITFTVEDLEEDIYKAVEGNDFLKKGSWSLAPLSTDWASIPIGHVFHPVDITKKEESKLDGETSSGENNENMYSYACEESKPVVTPRPKKFIFTECPIRSSMLYQRKDKKMEC